MKLKIVLIMLVIMIGSVRASTLDPGAITLAATGTNVGYNTYSPATVSFTGTSISLTDLAVGDALSLNFDVTYATSAQLDIAINKPRVLSFGLTSTTTGQSPVYTNLSIWNQPGDSAKYTSDFSIRNTSAGFMGSLSDNSGASGISTVGSSWYSQATTIGTAYDYQFQITKTDIVDGQGVYTLTFISTLLSDNGTYTEQLTGLNLASENSLIDSISFRFANGSNVNGFQNNTNISNLTLTVLPVPEPSIYSLLGIGCFGLILMRKTKAT